MSNNQAEPVMQTEEEVEETRQQYDLAMVKISDMVSDPNFKEGRFYVSAYFLAEAIDSNEDHADAIINELVTEAKAMVEFMKQVQDEDPELAHEEVEVTPAKQYQH